MKTALVIGATGLVGRQLVELLLHDEHWQRVVCFLRRSTGLQHEKLEEHIISFDASDTWRHLVKGDVLFSALGTTLKKAGSKEAQYKIDHTYQYQFAQAAAHNGVERYVLVSAANASLNSFFFYSRMKAELERDVQQLSFKYLGILRPGLLAGNRAEERTGEKLALKISKGLHKLPLLGFLKPIEGKDVAKAMIQVAEKEKEQVRIYSMQELFDYAAQYDQKHDRK